MAEQLIKLTVDGEQVSAKADETLLTVCRRLGKDIPTLCHHEGVEPYAACRVCMVEIIRSGWSSLVPSCHYRVKDGIEVKTDSDMVTDARRVVLELLLARCPKSDVVREVAARCGVTETPYASEDPEETCILCGLCVRACAAVMGDPTCRKPDGTPRESGVAIGFAGRGVDRVVTSPFEMPSEVCIGCDACINVCPTGHVIKRLETGKLVMETWHTKLDRHVCASCGETFLTEKQVAFIRDRAGQKSGEGEDVGLCPACRRKATGENLKTATKAMSALKTETIHVP